MLSLRITLQKEFNLKTILKQIDTKKKKKKKKKYIAPAIFDRIVKFIYMFTRKWNRVSIRSNSSNIDGEISRKKLVNECQLCIQII